MLAATVLEVCQRGPDRPGVSVPSSPEKVSSLVIVAALHPCSLLPGTLFLDLRYKVVLNIILG